MARLRAVPEVIARRGDLVVERDPRRPSGRLLRQDDMDASYVDLADSTHLEFDYLRWIRVVLNAAHARRVLHVGGAACALARALAAADPEGRQEVCESSAEVLQLARDHLGLRKARGLRVRHGEGRAHVAAQPDASWDAVVVDAFVGAVVPHALITAEALQDVARVAPLALVNVVDDRSTKELKTVGAAMRTAYPRAWALGGRTTNTVLVGTTRRLDLDRVAAQIAADPSPAGLTDPAALARATAGTPPPRD